ncbi:AAA domain-containing protein [uncultured Microscilla sp.]|uniref:AAA domain-containing protein n=1 Tax=uncultured Microscilla sp. TaxID=432653 RepID=UPI002611F521|nr:AAA domain-containing protein [uncultured Microscilla sp.]
MRIQQLVHYFKDCYQADQREATVWNLFDKKIEHKNFTDKQEQLLNQNLPQEYIPLDTAQHIEKELQLYQREKSLYYFAFFVTGNNPNEHIGPRKLCAPLLYYPAELIKEKEDYYVKIDFSKQQVNYPLLAMLNQPDHNVEEVFKQIPQEAITFSETKELTDVLKQSWTEVNFEEMYRYPEDLLNEEALKKLMKSKILRLVPASAAGVMMSSNTTRGVINELGIIGNSDQFSSALKALFGEAAPTHYPPPKPSLVPSVLSKAQKKVLAMAQCHPLSIVVGPPGTGKTYTIAALATDHLTRGESVLIASQMNHAVDVVGDKIEQQLGFKNGVIRGGKSQYMKDLKLYIKNILSGIGIPDPGQVPEAKKKYQQMGNRLQTIEQEIQALEVLFDQRVNEEIKWGNFIAANNQAKNLIKRWIVNFKTNRIRNKSTERPIHWELVSKLEGLLAQRTKLLKEYIHLGYQLKLVDVIRFKRKDLSNFLKAIKARKGHKQAQFFDSIDFDTILSTFPIWLVNLSDVSNVLPLRQDMFDVAIIDEASQCDIASCLAILQRAKRVVIVGDPSQLRHVSFLSEARQNFLRKQHHLDHETAFDLDYRNQSVLDAVNGSIETQDAITFLDEHYRSLPEIINFSNKFFYQNRLNLMTQTPHNERVKSLQLLTNEGERSPKGYNEGESEMIIARIKKTVENEQILSKDICHSIGVLSPFRAQVDYLTKRISEEISLASLKKHNLMVGTAHSFQGEERDMMFISFVVDQHSASGSFVHINKEDLFNVAITRARAKQFVVTSAAPQELKNQTLLKQYLSYVVDEEKNFSRNYDPSGAHCTFADEVETALQSLKYHCFRSYPIAGLDIDIVVQDKHKTMGINLIGFPGIYENAFTLERYKILSRAGVPIVPLPYLTWKYDRAKCIEVIEATLRKLK